MALAFVMAPQDEDNWCWLAVAASVAHCYSNPKTLPHQCDMAQVLLSGHYAPYTTCCVTPTACDYQGNPAKALHHVGHSDGSVIGLAPFADIEAKILAHRPVAISFKYTHSAASHVVAVTDAFTRNGTQMLSVEDPDPLIAPQTVRYGQSVRPSLPTTWVRTYFTKP